jgi:hypothetical protein
VRKGDRVVKGKTNVNDLKRLASAEEGKGPKFRRGKVQQLRTSKMRKAWKDCDFQLNKKSAQVLKMKEADGEKEIDKKHDDFKLQDVAAVDQSPGGQWNVTVMQDGKKLLLKFKSETDADADEWVKDINHNISLMRV